MRKREIALALGISGVGLGETLRYPGRARASLSRGQAVQHANPQATAIASLTGLPVEDATHWYAFAVSLALELAGMAAMMRAEAAPQVAQGYEPPLPAQLAHRAPHRSSNHPSGVRAQLADDLGTQQRRVSDLYDATCISRPHLRRNLRLIDFWSRLALGPIFATPRSP